MLLLRGILSHDPGQTVCSAGFEGDSLALFGPDLPATLAVELIAQTMAVHDGLRRRVEQRPAATSGLLLGSRRFELLARHLPAHEELKVVVTGEAGSPSTGGLVRFAGRVEDGRGNVLASGEVTVLEHRPEPA